MTLRKSRIIVLTCAAIIGAAATAPMAQAADENAATTGVVLPAKEEAYDKPYIGEMEVYTATYEDTLVKIARDNNLGFVELRAANPYIDPWIPGEGTKIILPKRHILPDAPREGIIINLPEMRLYAFVEKGQPPVSYPIGVGRDGLRTPSGTTKIIRKKTGPTWYPTARMREEDPSLPQSIPAGPNNPLGSHALYLGWPEYAIHGTNRPFGIGRRVSSGCIRLYPESIIELYELVDEGAPVAVVDQPVKATWVGDVFYVEAHPQLEQADTIEQNGGIPDYHVDQKEINAIIKAAGDFAFLINWEETRQVIRERAGVPVAVARKQQVMPQKPVPMDTENGDT